MPFRIPASDIGTLLLGLGTLWILKATPLLRWLLIQPAGTLLTGLIAISAIVLILATRVAGFADLLAVRLGEPYGTLVLTGSAITVELALIVSTMITGESNPTLARDSMFAVLMIALTGIKGISMLLAAQEQERELNVPVTEGDLASMNLGGSVTYINLIATMGVLALIVPNFTATGSTGNFSAPINAVLSVMAVGIYVVFLSYQVGSYRALFMESHEQSARLEPSEEEQAAASRLPLGMLAAGLGLGLLVLVLITESMGKLIEVSLTDLGLASSLGGVLVGLLVLAPEALNAFQAASRGQVQRSLNTLYGSALSTLCLTVPAVLLIGELTNTTIVLGLEPFEMVLLGLTIFLVRPISGRVNRLDGLILLAIFLFWIALQVA